VALIWYLSREEPLNIYDWVKRLASFKWRDWDQLVTDLRDTFPDEDQDKYAVSDLRALTDEQATYEMATVTELVQYRVRYERIAGWLREKEMISDAEMARQFYAGLPRTIRDALFVEARVRRDKATTKAPPTYLDIYQNVKSILGADDFYASNNRRLAKERCKEDAGRGRTVIKTEHASEGAKAYAQTVTMTDPAMETITKQLSQLQLTLSSLQHQHWNPIPSRHSPQFPPDRIITSLSATRRTLMQSSKELPLSTRSTKGNRNWRTANSTMRNSNGPFTWRRKKSAFRTK
jgi:hypothetical protein